MIITEQRMDTGYARAIALENKHVKKAKKSPSRIKHSKRDLRVFAAIVAVDVILAVPKVVSAIQDKLTDTCVPVARVLASKETPSIYGLVAESDIEGNLRANVDCTRKNNSEAPQIHEEITIYKAE